MDLKPAASRQTPPQAPLIDPQPPVMEDPFKPDQPQPAGKAPKPAKRRGQGGILKKLLLLVLILGLIGGAGYGAYYWQHKQVDTLAKQAQGLTNYVSQLQAQVTKLTADNKKLTDAAAVKPTADELVINAVTAYCQAQVDPSTAKALVYTQGTLSGKKVLYSTDKNFASVSGVCATTADSKDAAKTYYVKLSGTAWVVLYGGTTADAAATKLYNIPAATDFK